MATLRYNNIYQTVSASMAYVVESSKIVPQADIMRVQTYVKGDHSESPLYTVTYNCSHNIALAAEEFEIDRALYWAKRKSARLPGQTKEKRESLASHFFMSYRHDEWITSEEMLKILDEFIKENHLDDYRIIAAVHRNTRSPHVHFLVSAYPHKNIDKKLSMNNTKLKAMKRSLNRITYSYGYGFIDDKSLSYGDAEYAAFVSSVKFEGKVPVYPNLTVKEKMDAKIRRDERRKGIKQEKSILEQLEEISEYNKRSEWDNWKDQESDYYFDSSLIPSFRNQRKQYQMKLWDDNGRRRGTLELLLMLVAVLIYDQQQMERAIIKPMYSRKDINWGLQRMIDGIAAVRELGIMDEKQLQEQVSECGADISSIRQHIYYVRKALEQGSTPELMAEEKRYESLLKIHRTRYAKLMAIKAVLKDCYRPEYIYNICPEETLIEGVRDADGKEKAVEPGFLHGVFEESVEPRQELER